VEIKSQKFMFFDDWPYEYSRGFVRKQGKPVKYEENPILVPDRPHEYSRVSLYGTVLREDDLYKIWYPAFGMGSKTVANLCYAESKDGYNWLKPNLDVVPGTNIILDETHQVRGQSIIHDIEEKNPERRYKFLVRPGHTPSVFSYVSPDGVHWKILDKSAINADSDSHIGLIRHPETGIYMATMRKLKGDRRVWLSTSSDFEKWTDPVLVKELDINQSMQTQIYGMQLTYYGAYILGLVSYYNTMEDDLDGWGKMDGTMDIGFAYSRSGYCWHEGFLNDRFIEYSGKGSWDGQMIMPASHMILNDDEVRIYYAGCDHTHKPPYNPENKLSIGAASIRPDGFTYLEAGDEEAEIFTRIFAISEPGFTMNANTLKGEIKVQVCDGLGKPIKGFDFEDFIPVNEDGIYIQLQWKNNPDQSVLLNKQLRLRIKARNSNLYSVTMINGEDNPKYWKFREIDYRDILYLRNIMA
jgi:hypothetical protein